MYKIHCLLLWLLLSSPMVLHGQVPQSNRQTVFTAHLLTGQVDPGKKYEYDVLIRDQKVSLPCPIRFQTRNL